MAADHGYVGGKYRAGDAVFREAVRNLDEHIVIIRRAEAADKKARVQFSGKRCNHLRDVRVPGIAVQDAEMGVRGLQPWALFFQHLGQRIDPRRHDAKAVFRQAGQHDRRSRLIVDFPTGKADAAANGPGPVRDAGFGFQFLQQQPKSWRKRFSDVDPAEVS